MSIIFIHRSGEEDIHVKYVNAIDWFYQEPFSTSLVVPLKGKIHIAFPMSIGTIKLTENGSCIGANKELFLKKGNWKT